MIETKIGDLLLKHNRITQKQLDFGLKIKGLHEDIKLGEILRFYHFVTDDDIAQALAEQVGWNYYNKQFAPDQEALDKLGIEFFVDNMVYPLKSTNGKIFATPNIDDTKTTDFILSKHYPKARFVVGSETRLRKALDRLFMSHAYTKQSKNVTARKHANDIDFLIPWFHDLLNRAISKRASDIHIEGTKLAVEVRLRIDGVLVFEECLGQEYIKPLTNIIFGKCEIDPSAFRQFHDARFEHVFLKRSVDIRVSHIPSAHGSTLVLRLLDKGKATVPINELGYSEHNLNLLKEALSKPYGIILFTGPTGCGKTTALYSILNYLKAISKKIITIEDPIEITIPLITQVQINTKQGISFHNATKSFLRHDPDIMLIGEIRDSETAAIAVKASLTGHQVFSTLHTISPVDSLLRLQDLEIKPSLIANSLVCIVAQRLVRRLCPHCKEKLSVAKMEFAPIFRKYLQSGELKSVYTAHGCNKCIEGYYGRTTIVEILLINEDIKKFINQNNIASVYEYTANDKNYQSFTADAIRLIKNGTTSLEEVARILG